MSDNPTRSARSALLVLLAALFVAYMCAGVAVEPPPLRVASDATQFDARAAQARLARILGPQVAHPIDSAAEDDVRDRLLHEIEALGLQPAVHEAFACRPDTDDPWIECGYVRNIVFSLGPETGSAILAASHYDSVPAGPGATDDGIAIAVWLEVAQRLAHENLQRRLIFLISDGEEQALLGADYFGRHDPLMQSVTTLVNLEARGTRGPVVFFETNDPNADAVNAYSEAPRPLGNSVMADIYRRMPNSTDVSALTRPGLDVINIAVVDGAENYHTPQDTIARQDLRSLQHMGDHVAAIIGRLVSVPDPNDNRSLVYTDIASRFFIRLPAWLSHALLAAGGLVACALFWRAGRERRWRALAAPFVGLAMAAGLAYLTSEAFAFIAPGVDVWFAYPAATRAWCVAYGLLGVVGAIALIARRCQAAQIEDAGFLTFALAGALLAIVAPGISILFATPLVFYAVGALLSVAWPPARTVGATLAGLVTLGIWAPILHVTELALGFEMPFVFALLFALATLPWLGSVVRLNRGASWRWSVSALGFTAVAGIIATAFLPAATVARPHDVNLLHVSNAVTGEQRIVAGVAARALPKELAQAYPFVPESIFPGDDRRFRATPAPIGTPPLQGPALDGVRLDESGGQRTLHAHIRMNGAYRVQLRIPGAAKPGQLTLNRASASFADAGGGAAPTGLSRVACQGRTCDGAEIAVTLAGDPRAGDWYIVGYYPGRIDPAVAAAIARRPATATAIQNGDGAMTVSKVAF
jgi:hypothetical protein